ncbi:FAD-dependent oxidoreductase, partial [Mycobacterium sp. IS-1264]|uniref:NAD(P)/FAD-dependent oxidoreductase n=1 Tax=Mycobacterium sp. IS-1264 TaxID=1834158 RepID=UPI0011154DB6
MNFDTDLLIVGGGPGGLATALHARRQGLSVIIAEPRESPIDKACGEGLMPGGLRELMSLGVDPAGMPFHGIAYVGEHRRAEARFRAGPGRGAGGPPRGPGRARPGPKARNPGGGGGGGARGAAGGGGGGGGGG